MNNEPNTQEPNITGTSSGDQSTGQVTPPTKPKKPIYKRWWFIVIVVIIVVGGITNAIGGNTENSSTDSDEPVTSSEEKSSTDLTKLPSLTSEEGSTERVDEIAKIAKDNASQMNQETADKLVDYISKTNPNFYKDNKTMEKTMYYGGLLEYWEKGDEVYRTLGMDTTQAVKYVYRGAEKASDDSTKSNLSQIQKSLDKISGKESKTDAETIKETDSATMGESNALASALNYLSFSSFSKSGLVEQLKYEGYTDSEANYAVNNCGANWKEQAAKSAKNYLDFSSFSRDGLIEQLEYEGYTHEQAVYGVEAVGY